ncbi:MAG: PDZ domain-containing protein [Acidobacteriaceae bacterium]|nr:PDZ domain-containing protein [Acidobacteriaceae bacterium]
MAWIQRQLVLCALAIPLTAVAMAAPLGWTPLPGNGGRAAAQQRSQGYLGIEFHDLTDDQLAALHLKGVRGAEIVMVDHDGPAGKAGLCPRDLVVAINGQAVENAPALRKMIRDVGAGASISIEILRNGQAMTLNAQLADREEVEHRAALEHLTLHSDALSPSTGAELAPPSPASKTHSFISSMLHMSPFTGLAVELMEPQLAAYFGAPTGVGLLVNTVMAGSPAAQAGLRAGDVLLRVDSVALRSVTDWTRHLRESKAHALTLTVLRDRREQTVVLTPDLKRHACLMLPVLWAIPDALLA